MLILNNFNSSINITRLTVFGIVSFIRQLLYGFRKPSCTLGISLCTWRDSRFWSVTATTMAGSFYIVNVFHIYYRGSREEWNERKCAHLHIERIEFAHTCMNEDMFGAVLSSLTLDKQTLVRLFCERNEGSGIGRRSSYVGFSFWSVVSWDCEKSESTYLRVRHNHHTIER